MTTHSGTRLLVPVAESTTMRATVAYAVAEARAAAADGEGATLHFVHPEAWRVGDPAFEERTAENVELLERVTLWADTDLEGTGEGEAADDADPGTRITVETSILGRDRYLFSPDDYAEIIADYASVHDLDRVILDPEYSPTGSSPLLDPLQTALDRSGLQVEEAPVERQARRGSLVAAGGLQQYLVLFGTSFLFYVLLGWFGGFLDVLTGAVSATVVAVALGRVSLRQSITPVRALTRFLRFLAYIPYLVWEIVRANLSLAVVILHPRLPIDPELVGFRAAVWDDLSVTTLANSITLTPGTLTVDVTEREFYVHTLTRGSREDLFDGGLERAVRFVFYGRPASRIPSPREREDVRDAEDIRAGEGAAAETPAGPDPEAPPSEEGTQ